MTAPENVPARYDAETRRAVEREAIASAAAAAAREDRARLRAIERELGLGLYRQCAGCSELVPLADWALHCAARPDLCETDLKGKAA
jgi:DNA-binding GntR family transcriptional regulator